MYRTNEFGVTLAGFLPSAAEQRPVVAHDVSRGDVVKREIKPRNGAKDLLWDFLPSLTGLVLFVGIVPTVSLWAIFYRASGAGLHLKKAKATSAGCVLG